LKKEPKNFYELAFVSGKASTWQMQTDKSFLLLFLEKEDLPLTSPLPTNGTRQAV
jgi:hypothetical protein